MSSKSTAGILAILVGVASAVLAWTRITADSLLFGLLLAGLVGLAAAVLTLLVFAGISFCRRKRHRETPPQHLPAAGGVVVASPLEGTVYPLSGIEDPVFSAEVLGRGCAIEPSRGEVFAPVDGVVLKIAQSDHAISLRSSDGVELLIHVGMDTVERHGDGFEPQVQAGETVRCGQLLLKFDLQKIRAAGYPLTTPVIVTNSDAFAGIDVAVSGRVQAGQDLLLIR